MTLQKASWGLAAAVAAAAAVSAFAAVNPGVFQLPREAGLREVATVAGALALFGWVIRSPGTGLILLVGFVYLNLSQVLVRYHGLPSLLQLFVIPLMVSAWLLRGRPERERIARHPVVLLLGGLALITLWSSSYAWDAALTESRAAELFKGFVICLLLIMFINSRARLREALWAMVAAGAALGALGLFQIAAGDFSYQFGGLARIKNAQIYGDVFEPRIAGPLGDPNYFAQILLILVPLSLSLAFGSRDWWIRFAAFLAAGIIAVATVLTYSRGGTLALAVVVALSFLSRGFRVRDAVLAIALAALVLAVLPSGFTTRLMTLEQVLPGTAAAPLHPDSSIKERRLMTGTAWRMFLDHPLLGVGAGNFNTRFDEYADLVGSDVREYDDPAAPKYPHSLYLEIAAELGLVGLLLFTALFVVVILRLERSRRQLIRTGDGATAWIARSVQISLAGYLTSSLFLHGHYMRYLWLLLGVAVAVDMLVLRQGSIDVRNAAGCEGSRR